MEKINVDIRHKQLDSLSEFISSSKDKVQSILEELNWKLPMEGDTMTNCKVQSSHRVPLSRLKSHTKTCALKLEGYDPKEQFLSEPKAPSCESVHLDDRKKLEILSEAGLNNSQPSKWHQPDPKTTDRLFSTFTPNERAAMYDYVISATKPPPQPLEFNIWSEKASSSKTEEKKLSYTELEALERDAKRRRTKYKPKSVFVEKKCYKEILKEVIENQMEEYEDWVLDQMRSKHKKSKTEK